MIGTQLSSIKSELIKLEQEENNLKLELVSISKKKTPESTRMQEEITRIMDIKIERNHEIHTSM